VLKHTARNDSASADGLLGDGPTTAESAAGHDLRTWLRSAARGAPLTAVLVALLWSVGVATGSLIDGPPAALRAAPASASDR
jgi:hypothetical protein